MNGAILRDMALIGAANRALAGADVSGFWPQADAFAWYRAYRFVDAGGDGVAADPLAWFAQLRAEGRRGVRVTIGPADQIPGAPQLPEHQLSGFLGGGPVWRIEAVGDGVSAYWRAIDEVHADPPLDKPQSVACIRIAAAAPSSPSWPELDGAIAELAAALVPMIAIADQGLENFADLFRTALAYLDDAGAPWPRQGYYLDFERWAGFDARRMQVLAAITHAWVFGGMGSWNDVGPMGPETDRLFAALEQACAALANSTFPAP